MPKNETHDTHFLPDKRIVVVGDWLVDEHWVVGVHRSRTSSRVGKKHYRSIQTLGSTVTSFCGAGRTAAILHRARLKGDNDNFCGIVGLGVWHENDTSAMEAMLDSASVKGHTPHQIRLDYEGGEKACLLVNLASSNEPEQGPGTTRIIRIYQQTGSQVELVERIDWEVSTPPEGWFSLRDLNAHKKLQQALKLPIAAIVVKDIKKGAVSKELIKFLAHRFPDKPWFISSKEYIPSWMQFIKREWIHLLEIPQAACKDAIDKTNKSKSGKSRLDSWMSAPSEPSKGALDLLDQLGEDYENAVIVAVPDDQTVLAHRKVGFSKTGEKEGVVWTSRGLDATPVGMPLASVCFAAFTAHLLHTPKETLVKLVDMSMDFTEEWRSKEQGRVENPLNWDPKCEPSLDLSKGTTVHSKVLTWTDELERWRSAYRDVGVIKEGGRGYIDLSCAMTEVKNYVCICATKRTVLRQVVKEMQAFKNEGGARSTMIVASPGSGKSLLAQMLAEDQGLFFLEFNITQMMSKSDLLDCFDVISTTQFENPGTRLLVFIDEIDAPLGDEAVYNAFLAPLERGVYRRAGKTFRLGECFWLFAGTHDPTSSGAAKASDFVSRLTLKPCAMVTGKKDNYRLENVYLGVAILRTQFPDVREISTDVLKAFHAIKPDTSIRQLRQFVKDFVDIKSGEVRRNNIPQQWLAELGISRIKESSHKEVMVTVRGEALSPNVLARFTPEPIKVRARKASSSED